MRVINSGVALGQLAPGAEMLGAPKFGLSRVRVGLGLGLLGLELQYILSKLQKVRR